MVCDLKQSRAMSFVEATTNVVAGLAVAMVAQVLVFPLFGIALAIEANLAIASIFTALSVARSFLLRRLFEAIRTRNLRNSGSILS
jgi:hypothetical protein